MTASIRQLSAEDVAALMPPWSELIDLVQATLAAQGRGETGGFLVAAPASAGGVSGHAWVEAGAAPAGETPLPHLTGALILRDGDTPRAVLDAGAVTAHRTAACTALTARLLADPNSEVLVMLACGAQARTAIAALLEVFPDTERMLCYDPDVERQAEFADWVGQTLNIAAIVPPDPQECCEGAHVIVSASPASKAPAPVIEPGWLQTGTLCVPLDLDAYFTRASFEHADLLVTDDLAQFRHFASQGWLGGCPEPTVELPAIAAGQAPGRPDGEPIVMSVNLGLGRLDLALAELLLARAEQQQRGTLLGA